jgi:hypothetical protein
MQQREEGEEKSRDDCQKGRARRRGKKKRKT